MQARDFEYTAMASPQKDTGPETRTNFDKRSIRKMYGMPFEHAICDIRKQPVSSSEEPVLNYSSQDVQARTRTTTLGGSALRPSILRVL